MHRFNDYRFMRIASQDKAVLEFDSLGRPTSLPYCIINANRYYLPEAKIEDYLQDTTEDLWGDEGRSLKDFIDRLDTSRLLWRGLMRPTTNRLAQNVMYLDHTTHSSMINTGLGDLLVGDEIYALPAISFLANHNPSVNMFDYNGRRYVHPMILNRQDREILAEDIVMLENSPNTAKTSTLIGGLLKKYLANQEVDLDIPKLMTYLRLMRPIGTVAYNLEGHRRSVYDVTQNVVSLGSEFICLNEAF